MVSLTPSNCLAFFLLQARLLVLGLVFLGSPAAFAGLNAQEQAIANYMAGSGQHRPFVKIDPLLCQVARAHAADMAARHYYDHTNPEGYGPNWMVVHGGYRLPANYPLGSANNVESIDASPASADAAWSQWMNSAPHRQHLLAENSFYTSQTSLGVGFVSDPNSDWKNYWVVITAPPAPAVNFLSPASGATTGDSSVGISGTTSGNPAAVSVAYRVENKNGNGAWLPVAGLASWSATASGLIPGQNTIRVRSYDGSLQLLDEAARTITYAIPATLTVDVVGQGSISSGFAGSTQRFIGVDYAIKATPAAGYLFAGWSGTLTGATGTIDFEMAQGVHLTATFVPNPFTSLTGTYMAPITGAGQPGLAKVNLTATGAFTGSVKYGAKSYSLSGSFSAAGNATVTIARTGKPSLNLTLRLDVSGSGTGLSGTFSDGVTTAALHAEPAFVRHTTAYAHAGRYTVALPPDSASQNPDAPKGVGYATLKVTDDGYATLSGALPDGRTFSYGRTMTAGGSLPIFVPTGSAGFLAGELNMAASSISDLQGSLRWTRLARPTAPALDENLPVIGSTYTRPEAGDMVVSVPSGPDNSTLTLSEGGLSNTVVQPATLNDDNEIVLQNPVLSGLNATIDTGHGLYKGTFVHPVTHQLSSIRGVIFQKQNAGFGYFVAAAVSGYSELSSAR